VEQAELCRTIRSKIISVKIRSGFFSRNPYNIRAVVGALDLHDEHNLVYKVKRIIQHEYNE
jgi:hypothetical protein